MKLVIIQTFVLILLELKGQMSHYKCRNQHEIFTLDYFSGGYSSFTFQFHLRLLRIKQ